MRFGGLLCAAPPTWRRRGTPELPWRPGAAHDCIGIRQGDAYGQWRLTAGRKTEVVKVRGALSTNDGEIAVKAQALDGHGIVMRAEWDVARYLRSGRLVQVLADHPDTPGGHLCHLPQRHQTAARVRAFVDFLAERCHQCG